LKAISRETSIVLRFSKSKYHDLRATWATLMMNNGIEPIKITSMGGWKSLSRLQISVRKAGLNVKGITDNLNIHDPCTKTADVYELRSNK